MTGEAVCAPAIDDDKATSAANDIKIRRMGAPFSANGAREVLHGRGGDSVITWRTDRHKAKNDGHEIEITRSKSAHDLQALARTMLRFLTEQASDGA